MTTTGQEPQVTPTPQAGNQQQPATTPQPGNDKPDVFDREYVERLRRENAAYRTKANELESRFEEFETAQAKKREEELAQQNEWKKLAEERAAKLAEYEPIKTQYETMLETLKASNAKRIESIPEDRRSLIPEYDDPSKLAAWLDANAALLSLKPTAPNINGAAGSAHRPGAAPLVLSDDEIAVAKKMGLTPEQYAESKQKIKAR